MNRFIYAETQSCIGCHSCEIACVMSHNQNTLPEDPRQFLPRITVLKNQQKYTAVTCRHCEDAPCVEACVPEALIKNNDAIQLNEEKCIGCKDCLLACPFGVIDLVEKRSSEHENVIVAHKCDLCEEVRESPACIDACPTNAIKFYRDALLEKESQQKQWRSALGKKELSTKLKINSTTAKFINCTPRGNAIKITLKERIGSFSEIYQPFSQKQLHEQADRCLNCGDHAICEWTCPLHNRISHWIQLAKAGKIIEAVELSHQTNSLPEICGRVCPQERLCEKACTLNNKEQAVTIGNIERYITETALAMGWTPDLSHVKKMNKRVAIIGAGPSGLSCADVLARHGVDTIVFDRHPEIGGMLTFGIPAFKLEKEVMKRRRQIFTTMGIDFRLNTEIGKDINVNELLNEFDAIFVGVGTYQFMRAGLENENAQGVYEALPFLIANTKHVMGLETLPHEPYIHMKGKRVVVLGGGDTAMDCLRTSIRHGATSVICAYRRDEANMPGSRKEVQNAREEGVEFMFNLQPVKIETDKKGHVRGISMLRTELGEPDANGRRNPRPIEGSEFLLEADAIIMAFGFQPHNIDWLTKHEVELSSWGSIIAPPLTNSHAPCQTANTKIFAGGDAVRGADLVVTAIADGRKAAHSIIESFKPLINTGGL